MVTLAGNQTGQVDMWKITTTLAATELLAELLLPFDVLLLPFPLMSIGAIPAFAHPPSLIVIHLMNVGILEDEIDDGEEEAVGRQEEHERPVGAARRLAQLQQRKNEQ